MIVYKLMFSSTKVYIGQTVRAMQTRYDQHARLAARGSLLPVHAAWRKYGAPTVEILAEFYCIDTLNEAEIALIAKHDCLSPKGYNLAGGGRNSQLHSDTKAKLSAAHSGKILSDEHRARVGDASKRLWQNEAYRAKVLEGVAASFTPERRAALAEHAKRIHTGRVVSEETREKLRGRVMSEETRAKMSAAAKVRVRAPRSEETKAKIAASVRSARTSESTISRSAAISDALKKKHANMTPEQRQAFSEARKRAWETRRCKGKES